MNKILKTLSRHLAVSLLILGLLLILYIYQTTVKEVKISQPALCKDCNVILITMTNLRYDHMSDNGYFRPTTPNLDKLANESLVFDNAFSQSSWTLPQGISIFTGLYPYQHVVMNRYDGSKLSPDIQTLIDVLKESGYKTAAFTGGFDYNPKYGLSGRFDKYEECKKGQDPSQTFEGGLIGGLINEYGEFSCTIPKALDWLRQNASDNFFLFVQGYDVHCPFSQQGGKTFEENYQGTIDYSQCLWTFDRTEPVKKGGKTYYPVHSSKTGTQETILLGEEDIDHLIALYDEGIFFADQVLGSFFREVEEMGLLDNTVIIFTSEHGDMFGKYGRFMRGGPLRGTFYDDVLHVPLIVQHPKLSSGRYQELVEQIDLAPTLLDFLGLGQKLSLQGKSLIPLILDGEKLHDYVFAGAEFSPDANNLNFSKKTIIEAIRNKEWKLMEETIFEEDGPKKTIELYNITSDKEELQNLAESQKEVLEDLQTKLKIWSEKIKP